MRNEHNEMLVKATEMKAVNNIIEVKTVDILKKYINEKYHFDKNIFWSFHYSNSLNDFQGISLSLKEKLFDFYKIFYNIDICIFNDLYNVVALDLNNYSVDEEDKKTIINAFRTSGYEYGLRIREIKTLKYVIYWDKIHFFDYSLQELGINRFNYLLEYKDIEKADEKVRRLLR